MPSPANTIFFTSLSAGQGLIRATGADAEKFLQGQFSNDLRALQAGCGQWSSYNTPKGRIIANFYVQRDREGFWLSMARDLADPVLERLRKFRLMSKVELERGEPEWGILGIAGPESGALLSPILGVAMAADANTGQVGEDWIVTRLPWAKREAYLLIVRAQPAAALRQGLVAGGAAPADYGVWQEQAIRSGVALISLATTEKVIPQELNLEPLGGISFTKGCYPGQEIVARSHYLGRLKNQTYRVQAGAPLTAGDEIYADTLPDQSIGLVINAIATASGWEALAVLRAANSADILHAGKADGTPLKILDLPYPLPLDTPREP
ncbi:MAG: CAF17-like 4Fe-4S cluster assembly/insertion protein YgfZ [Acidithiobacillus sp.]